MNILKGLLLSLLLIPSPIYASETFKLNFRSNIIFGNGISITRPRLTAEYSDLELIYSGPNTFRVELGGVKIERKIKIRKVKTFSVDFTDRYAYTDRYIRKTKYSSKM